MMSQDLPLRNSAETNIHKNYNITMSLRRGVHKSAYIHTKKEAGTTAGEIVWAKVIREASLGT